MMDLPPICELRARLKFDQACLVSGFNEWQAPNECMWYGRGTFTQENQNA